MNDPMEMISADLPAGWGLSRLKWLLSSLESGRREVSETEDFEGQVLSIGGEHVGWKGEWLIDNPRYVSHEFFQNLNSGKIKQNDVLLVKDGATIGKVAIADPPPAIESAVNEHVFLLRFAEHNHAKFYFYVLQSGFAQDQIWLEVRGSAQPGLNSDFRNTLLLPHPSKENQIGISKYLDREIAQVDSLIAVKERLLELLAEKRRALITQAVTKGLNPKAPMRDSGLAWLGEIPRHWEAKKLKYIAEISYGVGDELDKGLTTGIPLISLPNVTIRGELDLSDVGWADLGDDEKDQLLLRKGDLLFNWRNGSSAHVGKTAVFDADGEYTHVGFLLRIRFDTRKYESRFFHAFLNTLRATGFFLYTRAMVNNTFNQTELENLHVAIPPTEEQRSIVTHLQIESSKIDALVVATQNTVDLLRERRSALIAAAVTGKIDITQHDTHQALAEAQG